jgi:hypothetical protein
MWVQALKTYQSIVAVRPDALGAMYGKMSVVAQRLVEEKQQWEQERQHLSKFAATNPALAKQLALMTYARAKGYPLSIVVEGQEEGDHHQDKMGVYELVEGKQVNARGVWKRTGKEEFMYYASSHNEWWISFRESMEAGEARGWMYVASTALTPDKTTEGWRVSDGTVTGTWHDAPKVRARLA